jgi:hypothetical protein
MGDGKVVGLAEFREQRGMRSTRVETVMDCGPFKSFILADGSVDIDIDGHCTDGTPIVMTVNVVHENMGTLLRGLLETTCRQDIRLKHLRSADQWIARPHPTNPTLRLITFDDHERPFRRVEAGKRSRLTKTSALEYVARLRRKVERLEVKTHGAATRAHWHCSGCGACIVAGASMWVEEHRAEGLNKTWPDAKLCDQCAEPAREGIREVVDGCGDGLT